jgi:hypothetical protein
MQLAVGTLQRGLKDIDNLKVNIGRCEKKWE